MNRRDIRQFVKQKILPKLYIVIIVAFISFVAVLAAMYYHNATSVHFEGLIAADNPIFLVDTGVFDINETKLNVVFRSAWWDKVSWWTDDGDSGEYMQLVEDLSTKNPRSIAIPRMEMYCVLQLPQQFVMDFDETAQRNAAITSIGYTDLDNDGVLDYTLIIDFSHYPREATRVGFAIFVVEVPT